MIFNWVYVHSHFGKGGVGGFDTPFSLSSCHLVPFTPRYCPTLLIKLQENTEILLFYLFVPPALKLGILTLSLVCVCVCGVKCPLCPRVLKLKWSNFLTSRDGPNCAVA